MYGTSDKLDEFVAEVPSLVLAKHADKCTGGSLGQLPILHPDADFTYHIRVQSEENPEVSIFIFRGSEDEVLAKVRPLRGS